MHWIPHEVVPLALEVNDPEKRAAVAAAAADVTWLINNAGVPGSSVETERRVLAASNLDDARFVMETNCWAPTELTRMFVPIIRSNGGGAIVNVLSVGAWYCVPAHTTYSMAKAAAMMMTAGFRAELHREPILVSGVFTAGIEPACPREMACRRKNTHNRSWTRWRAAKPTSWRAPATNNSGAGTE